MTKQRLVLAVPVEPRDSIQGKDATTINIFMDQDPMGVVYATKRAGYILKTNTTIATVSKGILFSNNQNKLYYINDSKVPVIIP